MNEVHITDTPAAAHQAESESACIKLMIPCDWQYFGFKNIK